MSYLDRVLADGTDREAWEQARWSVIGASDAAKLSKLESIESYLASKLRRDGFDGNAYTASGHRWEPMMLAWAGIPQSQALIHSPDEPGFAATPDGILQLASGALRMAECKAKHGVIVNGPTLGEWRQVTWQFRCLPEAESIEWVWAEILNDDIRGGEPKHITIPRNHPKVRELLPRIEPIATELLARLRIALEAERQLAS
ncbi:hypothetical protein [Kitasatospora herbaricolor]|uniref:hypothetical protein n=1 Tax=Kitasatospora herbaricolor TaxID=68217 RepID=UPI0036D97735